MRHVDPDEWPSMLAYRAGYARGDDAGRRIMGLYLPPSEQDRRLEAERRELLSGVEDEAQREGVEDGLAGRQPRW